MNRIHRGLMLLATLFLIAGAWAESGQTIIERARFQNQPIELTAHFKPGDIHRPAVVILHGFLATGRFSTVAAMRRTAEDAGLAVLTPNLSYGYSRRNRPLKCTSLHRHRPEDALAELDVWLRWLHRRGYRQVVLIGHSSASTLLLRYLETHAKPPLTVRGLVLTSLFPVLGPAPDVLNRELTRAREAVSKGDTTPQNWHFQFCHGTYLATPESYLSYQATLTRPWLRKALETVAARVPTYIIMGGADRRLQKTGTDLLDDYGASGARLIIIKDANHFFSQEHEFDLQDHIEEILDALTR